MGTGSVWAVRGIRVLFWQASVATDAGRMYLLGFIIPKPKHYRSSFEANGRLKENQEGHFRLVARRMAAKGVISEAAAEGVDLSRVVLTGEAGKMFR